VGPVDLLVPFSFPGYPIYFQTRPGHSVFSDAGSSFEDISCHCLFYFSRNLVQGNRGVYIGRPGPPLLGKLIKYQPIPFGREKFRKGAKVKEIGRNRKKEEREKLNADWA
jgi:hypothetical protein